MYTMAVVFVVSTWTLLSIFKIMERDRFFIMDFRIPMYMPGEPFTITIFILGIFLQVICATNAIAKKSSIDVYIIHLITIITSEYRYISNELENFFHVNKTSFDVNLKINYNCVQNDELLDYIARKNQLKKLIRHHNSVTK